MDHVQGRSRRTRRLSMNSSGHRDPRCRHQNNRKSRSTGGLSIFADLDYPVVTSWAFEGAALVTRLIRLNSCKPHLLAAFWALGKFDMGLRFWNKFGFASHVALLHLALIWERSALTGSAELSLGFLPALQCVGRMGKISKVSCVSFDFDQMLGRLQLIVIQCPGRD